MDYTFMSASEMKKEIKDKVEILIESQLRIAAFSFKKSILQREANGIFDLEI
jgi:hypothetical protein